jgi:hypothetical protein
MFLGGHMNITSFMLEEELEGHLKPTKPSQL